MNEIFKQTSCRCVNHRRCVINSRVLKNLFSPKRNTGGIGGGISLRNSCHVLNKISTCSSACRGEGYVTRGSIRTSPLLSGKKRKRKKERKAPSPTGFRFSFDISLAQTSVKGAVAPGSWGFPKGG